MGKNKLRKFAEMKEMANVVECPRDILLQGGFPLKGKWRTEFFAAPHPIVLELGCGKGEYTVGLARRNPECNYIGIDIKGARMYSGAREALTTVSAMPDSCAPKSNSSIISSSPQK